MRVCPSDGKAERLRGDVSYYLKIPRRLCSGTRTKLHLYDEYMRQKEIYGKEHRGHRRCKAWKEETREVDQFDREDGCTVQ
jgi:hypothetical protein